MRRIGRRAALVRTAVVLACSALVATGCTSPFAPARTPAPGHTWGPEATKAPSSSLQRYYSQELSWTSCETSELECAWLTVPVDYTKPAGDTIKLAVARSVAPDSRGSVVVNPGGPGASGVDFVSEVVAHAGKKLTDSLDVVGFDPRGVARSAPVTCMKAADLDTFFAADPDLSTKAGMAQAQALDKSFGQGCLDRTGPLLAHVDTISAARDMDVLRAALREDTLTYLGFSYGTQLGATYASLFPHKVGRMVLDGALDPTLSQSQSTISQAGGFESALRAYVKDCLKAADCPLSGSVDHAMSQIGAVLDQTRAHPMDTGTSRALTSTLAFYGVAVTLYNQSYWTLLTDALTKAIKDHDGSGLLGLADSYLGRDSYGSYSNEQEAFISIGCVDDRGDADPAAMAAEAKKVMAVAPTMGRAFTYGALQCASWPVPEVGPLDSYAAKGAPPIVVVGTTNDPATPYSEAQSLAKILDSGVLLTYRGEGHTAYLLSGSSCIRDAVDGYLVDGTVPKDGLTC